jgi:hypothetical protein
MTRAAYSQAEAARKAATRMFQGIPRHRLHEAPLASAPWARDPDTLHLPTCVHARVGWHIKHGVHGMFDMT